MARLAIAQEIDDLVDTCERLRAAGASPKTLKPYEDELEAACMRGRTLLFVQREVARLVGQA